MGWRDAGEAWGARAWDWALYQEPFHLSAYEAVLSATSVGVDTRVLDVGCGSGMLLQLAAARGASVTGVDASAGLLEVARARVPGAELVLGPMEDLAFPDGSFDVVVSVNGLQYGTGDAMAEAARVVRPGGLLGFAFWQDHGDHQPQFDVIGALSPPSDHTAERPRGLSEPGVAEAAAEAAGLRVLSRTTVECVGVYRNLEDACRGMAASGPAWGAIRHSGEALFEARLMAALAPYVDASSGCLRLRAPFAVMVAQR
jgi:SAM-dependent methyltransferase